MKIVFICGSLEAGKDGVGDYTRRLSGELMRMGHEATIISIQDKFIAQQSLEKQNADGTLIPVLRIPASLGLNECFKIAELKIKAVDPNWISLQFVPFSFHPKGLSISLGPKLKVLVSGYRLHIMFHELWVGINSKVKFKMQLLGFAQKILIRILLRTVKPNSITTSTMIYRKALSDFSVKILPLFGNVPLSNLNDCRSEISSDLKVVHFGSFSGAADEFSSQLQFLVDVAAFSNRKMELVTFGDGGPFKGRAIATAKHILGEDKVVELGRLPFTEISCILQTADIGISRANYTLSGKSGSTLAMIEHGLPVLLRGKRGDIMGGSVSLNDKQLFFCDSEFSMILKKWPVKSGLEQTTKLFVEFLN